MNAAGITSGTAAVHEVALEDWDRIIAVNQTGVMLGMRMATRMMRGRGGSIVNIASIWGLVGSQGQIAYHASKAAVMGMSRDAAITYARDGIRVNSIHPGLIGTEMVRRLEPERVAGTLALTPTGRMGAPDEVAAGVVFLASDESSFVDWRGLAHRRWLHCAVTPSARPATGSSRENELEQAALSECARRRAALASMTLLLGSMICPEWRWRRRLIRIASARRFV